MPQRGAASGIAAGEQQGARGTLAEPRREQGRAADLLGDDVVDLVGLEDHQCTGGRLGVGVGDPDDDAVVGRDGLTVDAVALAQPGIDGQRPGSVHRHAVRRVHHQAPVAELVAESLDEQGLVAREHVGGLQLLVEVGDEVAGGPLVEPALAGPGLRLGPRQCTELTRVGADRGAELGRPAEGVALPERQPPGDAGGGGDQHPVVGDVLDPPARGAEGEDVAHPRLIDHLLVELAHSFARPLLAPADQEDTEQPAVGNGAAARDGESLRAGTSGQRPGDPIPHDARAQLGEFVARVAAAQQVEGGVVGRPRQLGERRAATYEGEEDVGIDRLQCRRGDDLLGEDVEGVGGDAHGLDTPGAHPLDRDRRLGEVAAVLGIEHTTGDLTDLVAGPADPLQSAGDARWRLDLDHQVDGTHVDAELEAARGHDRRQPSALQVVLDQSPLLLAHRAVVGLGDHGLGAPARSALRHDLGGIALGLRQRPLGARRRDLVEPCGQSLRQATGVGEDDGRGVRLDQVDDALLDVGPDAAVGLLAALCSGADSGPVVEVARCGHVLDRHDDLQVPTFVGRRGDDLDRGTAAEEPGDLIQRPNGGGQADPLDRAFEERIEPLQAECEVSTTLAARHRMDLVDDHRLDPAQGLTRLAGQHQEQRLGRGDQDVGRRGAELAPVARTGVTGADTDPELGQRAAEPVGGVPDAGQRRAQVALDVDAQCLERADVEHPGAFGLVRRRRCREQPVNRPQERTQRLAGPCRSHHQRVLAGPDRSPGPHLGRGGLGEGSAEPGAGRVAERGKRCGGLTHCASLPAAADSHRTPWMQSGC